MNTRSICLIVFGAALVFSGCGEKRIDTSNEERMKKSIKDVRASLPAADQEKFDESLTAVTTSKFNADDVFSGNTAGLMAKVEQSLEGKTAREIIAEGQVIIAKRRVEEAEQRAKEEARRIQEEKEAEARRIKEQQEAEERRAREMQQAQAEIAELTQKKQRAEEAKIELGKFKVTRSRFYRRKNDIGINESIIELALTNDTGVAVSRTYFVGTLASPGRSIPWLKEDFNYTFPGGMEPGESKELKLAPNMFSKWGRVDSPADAILTAEVVRVDGPDGKAAFDSEAFTEDDAKRLAELQQKFPK